MVTDRPYRKALSREETLAEIERCKGGQFDPDMADRFVEMMAHEPRRD
jgi:HD-GYP domain-containing protein (c-di-GMP phosphodiesterase class II)